MIETWACWLMPLTVLFPLWASQSWKIRESPKSSVFFCLPEGTATRARLLHASASSLQVSFQISYVRHRILQQENLKILSNYPVATRLALHESQCPLRGDRFACLVLRLLHRRGPNCFFGFRAFPRTIPGASREDCPEGPAGAKILGIVAWPMASWTGSPEEPLARICDVKRFCGRSTVSTQNIPKCTLKSMASLPQNCGRKAFLAEQAR